MQHNKTSQQIFPHCPGQLFKIPTNYCALQVSEPKIRKRVEVH